VDLGVTYQGKYYLADDTNHVVQIVDISSLSFEASVSVFINTGSSSHAGPNGLTVVTTNNELWVGNTNSTVTIISLANNTVVGTVNTGGTGACDELDFDSARGLVVVTNPDDNTPFITFIDVSTRAVVNKLTFSDASSGLEQPIFNHKDGLLYLSVPVTTANSEGEIKVIDPTSFSVTRVIPEDNCKSRGGAFANDGTTLMLACGSTDPLHFHSLLLDVSSSSTISTISDIGEGDEVAYDSTRNVFFVTGYRISSLSAVLGVISTTGTVIQIIDTDVDISHSVAVDPVTGDVFVPLSDGLGIFMAGVDSIYGLTPIVILVTLLVRLLN